MKSFSWKMGFRYSHGKLLMFKGNPGEEAPSWAVDIREIIAMVFVGMASMLLLYCREYEKAQTLLIGLLAYATGRTVPGGVQKYPKS